jgi:hypothetical protein
VYFTSTFLKWIPTGFRRHTVFSFLFSLILSFCLLPRSRRVCNVGLSLSLCLCTEPLTRHSTLRFLAFCLRLLVVLFFFFEVLSSHTLPYPVPFFILLSLSPALFSRSRVPCVTLRVSTLLSFVSFSFFFPLLFFFVGGVRGGFARNCATNRKATVTVLNGVCLCKVA